jgi:hypothetical protein
LEHFVQHHKVLHVGWLVFSQGGLCASAAAEHLAVEKKVKVQAISHRLGQAPSPPSPKTTTVVSTQR